MEKSKTNSFESDLDDWSATDYSLKFRGIKEV